MSGLKTLRSMAGMTLVEVMVTVVFVAIAGISILTGISYGIIAQKSVHERNGALRLAAEILEDQEKVMFLFLEPFSMNADEAKAAGYSIYDNGTPGDVSDDSVGTVTLAFYDVDGNPVGGSGQPEIPSDGSMIRAEVTISWAASGRGDDEIRLSTMIAP